MEESIATRKPYQVELTSCFRTLYRRCKYLGGGVFFSFFACVRSSRLNTQYHSEPLLVFVKYGPPRRGAGGGGGGGKKKEAEGGGGGGRRICSNNLCFSTKKSGFLFNNFQNKKQES